jgi:hypothetical protein
VSDADDGESAAHVGEPSGLLGSEGATVVTDVGADAGGWPRALVKAESDAGDKREECGASGGGEEGRKEEGCVGEGQKGGKEEKGAKQTKNGRKEAKATECGDEEVRWTASKVREEYEDCRAEWEVDVRRESGEVVVDSLVANAQVVE